MSRGCSCLGRFFMMLLVAGLLVSLARGIYRSGYQQGFVQGAVVAATDGAAAAAPAFYGASGSGGLPVIAFGFVAFFGLMLLFGRGRRRHWAHEHGHAAKPHDDIGPEKQPEDFV